MAFEHYWTCPAIDNSIRNYKDNISQTVTEILDETCPLIEGEQKDKLVFDWTDYLYDKLEEVFESVRETNRGIRDAAEKQIDELEERIIELQKIVDSIQ